MLFELNPQKPGGDFVRVIRLDGQPARMCRFKLGTKVDLNAAEQKFMAVEIANNWIGQAGRKFPPPPKRPTPRLYPGETPRDENFDPIEESTIELSGWQRCLRDFARRHNGTDRF